MLFDIPFVADWKQIGDYRQSQTDPSNTRENNKEVDYDYKVGDKILQKGRYLPQIRVHMEKRTMRELSGFNAEPNRKELTSGE
jgi:hypothetical protein